MMLFNICLLGFNTKPLECTELSSCPLRYHLTSVLYHKYHLTSVQLCVQTTASHTSAQGYIRHHQIVLDVYSKCVEGLTI